MPGPRLSQSDIELLAHFRHQLRRFLRASEELARAHGCTAQQYQLLLQLRGFPGRRWASIAELAERLQAQHHGVVALVTRYSSLSALVAAALSPVWAGLLGHGEAAGLILVLAIVIFVRHHENIRRLLAGTEPRIGRK